VSTDEVVARRLGHDLCLALLRMVLRGVRLKMTQPLSRLEVREIRMLCDAVA